MISVGNTEIGGTAPETGTLRAAALHVAAAFPWLMCQGLAQLSGVKPQSHLHSGHGGMQ